MHVLLIATADGSNRRAVTPGEQLYARALQIHGSARKAMAQAVTEEREARERLQEIARKRGPSHPDTGNALEVWRDTVNVTHDLEKELRRAHRKLQAALEAWAAEEAATWSAA